ncbi:MAG TPA: universal stress protein [Luteibacter sp.]|uniref:universal stress protein n=1 Tax=Luteibacter sp. TaxID=1886636 RepID=UPI002C03BC51|nr:universal stress protein [Luteibacter sp.]HVI55971.1 universal stress protein [Luteibacter sp.]
MSVIAAMPSLEKTEDLSSPWRDIAVALTQTGGDAVAVEVAGGIAREYGARLDVLQLVVMPAPMIDAWAMVPDAGFAQVYTDLCDAAEVKAEALRKTIATLGVPGDVRTLEALFVEPGRLAASAARASDLIVMARPFDAPADTAIVHAYFATLLHETGRPILVVPSSGLPLFPPHHAVLAWADTAESARALHDALPFLQRCESVDVILVDPVATALEAREARGNAVVRHLVEHGVAARVVSCKSRGKPVGAVLLDHARHSGAQLIVAGGYGHSKLREWVIGGTTRDLFLDAPVPVLFSH